MRTIIFVCMLLIISMPPLIDVSASTDHLVINEIQISGGIGHSNDDFIELYNPTSLPLDITNWKLKKRIKTGTESTIQEFEAGTDEKIIIPAKGYFLWANKDGIFSEDTESAFTSTAILADNYSLGLFDEKDVLVDALTYGSGHTNPYSPSIIYPANPNPPKPTSTDPDPKLSLERDLPNSLFVPQKNPTPENNTFIEKEKESEVPIKDDGSENISDQDITIRINEIFPNPKEKGEDSEFIELFNFGGEELDLAGLVLRDASTTGKYIFPTSSSIAPGGYYLVKKELSKLSLNNSEESISLFDTKENLINSVSYEKTKEEASFGFDGSSFRWSKHLTPGEANEFDALPHSKTSIPKKAYKNIPANFQAKDSDGKKFTWDFGDGTKSYKAGTTHTYKNKGTFKGVLTVDNGFEETKKYFTVKVTKLPRQTVSIVEISANPEGPDSENEYLLLQNNGKKKVDLSGWSVASGTQEKKLTNHPIREKFVIKKGETKKLDSAFSSFTLPNKSGFIELRQPDGKVAQKIAYQNTNGIQENEAYVLQSDKKWSWSKATQPSMPTITDDLAEDRDDSLSDSEEELAPKNIQLEDLAPDQRALLETEVEKRLREKILAEVKEQLASESQEQASQNGPGTDENTEQDISAENYSSEEISRALAQESESSDYSGFRKIMSLVFSKANASINGFLLEPNEN